MVAEQKWCVYVGGPLDGMRIKVSDEHLTAEHPVPYGDVDNLKQHVYQGTGRTNAAFDYEFIWQGPPNLPVYWNIPR